MFTSLRTGGDDASAAGDGLPDSPRVPGVARRGVPVSRRRLTDQEAARLRRRATATIATATSRTAATSTPTEAGLQDGAGAAVPGSAARDAAWDAGVVAAAANPGIPMLPSTVANPFGARYQPPVVWPASSIWSGGV